MVILVSVSVICFFFPGASYRLLDAKIFTIGPLQLGSPAGVTGKFLYYGL